MNFNPTGYWDLFTSYTNPVAIAWSGIKFAALGFFIFLILVILLRKYILVKRKYLFFKILAWTYIILLPFFAGFFGFKWGMIRGIRNDLSTHMSAYTSGMDKMMLSYLDISPGEFMNELKTGKDSANLNLTADEAVDRFAANVYSKFGSTIEKSALETNDAKGKVAYLFLHITQSAGISYGLKEGIRKLLHDELGVEEGTSKELMSTKFKTLLDKGLFTSIMTVQTDRFFNNMLKSLLILFAAILAFPLVEILISNILYRRKMKSVK